MRILLIAAFALTASFSLVSTYAVALDTETENSCASSASCSSCLRKSGCTWHESLGYCEKGCGLNGCGATKCASEITTCRDCLTVDAPAYGQYSWSVGKCFPSCANAPADAACYPGRYVEGAMKTYESSDCSKIDGGRQKATCSSISSNCNKCLKEGCAWSVGKCHNDCRSAPADAACSQGKSATKNRSNICASDFYFEEEDEDMAEFA